MHQDLFIYVLAIILIIVVVVIVLIYNQNHKTIKNNFQSCVVSTTGEDIYAIAVGGENPVLTPTSGIWENFIGNTPGNCNYTTNGAHLWSSKVNNPGCWVANANGPGQGVCVSCGENGTGVPGDQCYCDPSNPNPVTGTGCWTPLT